MKYIKFIKFIVKKIYEIYTYIMRDLKFDNRK